MNTQMLAKKMTLIIAALAIFIGTATAAVTSFTLINADTDTDIQTIANGATINLATLPTTNINIRANVDVAPASVAMSLSGSTTRSATESVAPYALWGDTSGNYNPAQLNVGNHTLTATPSGGTAYTVNFTVVSTTTPPPQPPVTAGIYGELKKWHKITILFDGPFTSETAAQNPFLNYRLNVTFTHPVSGKSYVISGYYAADGNAAETGSDTGNKWAVHFAPDEIGSWNYTTSFRTGANIAIDSSPTAGTSAGFFDGNTNSFTITASDKTGRDHRGKGRLQYVGEHYLRFADSGEYFLKQGSDAPENLLAYEDFDNTPNNGGRLKSWSPHADDWQSGDPSWMDGKGTELIGAVNYMASEGMNAMSFLTMSADGDDQNVFMWHGPTAYQRYDVSKCAQWEVVFEHMDKSGIYLHFKTQETENDQKLDGGALGTNRKLYYRELIARFGHHLALNWNLGEENTNTDQQRKDFAQFFHDNDPYRHHVVVHTFPNDKNAVYTPLLGNNSKFTGLSLQSDWSAVDSDTENWVKQSAAAGKKWVVANDEQGSANDGIKPDSANDHHGRRKETLWGCLMGGGAGNEYYFGYSHAHSDLTCQDFRSRDQWWDYCRYALEFFKGNDIPVHQMVNDNAKSTATNDYSFYKQGEVYVVYLKNGGTTSLNLSGVSGNFDVKWFNPRTGGALQNGSVTTVSGGETVALGNAPSETTQDWAILVQKQVETANYKVLYLYGSVKDDGTIQAPVGQEFHQMRLTDTGNRGMSEFKAAIENANDAIMQAANVQFEMVEAYDAVTELTPELLNQYKVIIIGSTQKVFSNAERTAVGNWVNAGGGLIAYSDSAFGGNYQMVGVGNTVGRESNNSLTTQFGMYFMRDNGAGNYAIKQWESDHYLNDMNQNEGVVFRGEGVSVVRVSSPAQVLAKLQAGGLNGQIRLHTDDGAINVNTDAAVAVAEVGQGRVIGTFDRNTFWNAGEGTRITDVDNREYAQRMVIWASGKGEETSTPNSPPVANAGVDQTVTDTDGNGNQSVTLNGSGSSDPDGTIASYVWRVGTTQIATGVNPSVVLAVGTHTITLTVTDNSGATGTDTVDVTVISNPVVLREPENPPSTQAGIEWERYLGNWSALPNFDALTAAAQGTTSVIGLGLGEPADYYAYRFTGYIDVPVDGSYTFYTSSDDGSKLYIGSTEVVNNDGLHGAVEKSGSIGLKAGKHAMTVTFFERTGGNVLDAYWQGPGLAKQEIPASALLRNSDSNTAPVANAGVDQTVTDTDNSGSENVTLNASGSSDPDGTIASYVWKEGTTQIATGVSPTITLAVGTHTITLTVTDNSGATGTDTVVVTVNSAPQNGEIVFAVNAGGGAFIGADGTTYSADTNFSGGAIYTKNNAIAGTEDDVLYQSERYGNFSYNIPLENGEYEVVLKFAEIYWTAAGKRIFDTSIEGGEVISNLDIFSQAGTNAAHDVTIPVTVEDGALNIAFNTDVNHAKVSAILVRKAEVTPVTFALAVNSGSGDGVYAAGAQIQISADTAPTGQEFDAWTGDTSHLANPSAPTTTVTMPSADLTVSAAYKDLPQADVVVAAINAGGGAFTGADGTTYSADTNFSGGTIYVKNTAIAGTVDDTLYQSERYGNFSYNIPVENGDYSVVLKFAEVYWTAAGKRVFDATIEGNEVISDLDIFSQVGTNAAHDITIPVTVNDGILNISFNTLIDNAKVSAVVVVKLGTTPQAASAEEFAIASVTETGESDQASHPVIPSGEFSEPSLAGSENKTGYKVGTLLTEDELHMAYIENPWGIRLELGTLGGENSYAFSINDQGVVYGAAQKADGTYHAFKYSNEEMLDVGKLGNVEDWNLAQGVDDEDANLVGTSDDAAGIEKLIVFGNGENTGNDTPTGWCLESDGKLKAVFWDEAETAN